MLRYQAVYLFKVQEHGAYKLLSFWSASLAQPDQPVPGQASLQTSALTRWGEVIRKPSLPALAFWPTGRCAFNSTARIFIMSAMNAQGSVPEKSPNRCRTRCRTRCRALELGCSILQRTTFGVGKHSVETHLHERTSRAECHLSLQAA